MRMSRAWEVSLGLLLLAGTSLAREIPLSDEPTPQRSWLDGTSLRWNVGANLPLTEPTQPLDRVRCKAEIRAGDSDEEWRVEAAGWFLVEPVQRLGQTALVTGTESFDGLCRPTGIQVFAFADGEFVGTLAPQPMPRRADGELLHAQVTDDGASVIAEFARYGSNDPLCCPKRASSVIYRIERAGAAPALLPESISTDRLPLD
jgi:hypothetical protein